MNFIHTNLSSRKIYHFTLALLILPLIWTTSHGQKLDMRQFGPMVARSIGPAGMSGRVTSIDVVLSNTDIMYVGTASGGVWKSESGGVDWRPIFDDQKTASIGAVAICQSNPAIIWVGTGEGNPRNSQSSGYGVYKSMDAGHTWTYMGLGETRNIHRVIIDPRDPDVVYIGAQGPAWGDTDQRGLYKTTDGGETWEKILYENERTGIADLVMDPSNPNKLIAAMWEFRRWPWFFESGGKGSGLHITHDGGKTWKKMSDKEGMPKGNLGRIGLTISQSDPNRIYAIIEAKKNALYRSDNGGLTWRQVNQKGNFGNRPFYYADIYCDPENENRIYSIHSIVTMSEDGGKNWSTLIPYSGVHPDHHAWWIHPEDGSFMIDGNDGGMAITHDRGKNWRFVENLPLAQFYHINIDNEYPYGVYGGMQDNGSWGGPAYVLKSGGIRNSYWQELAFGDGFDVVPDPEDSRYGFAMSQGGFVSRYDRETGRNKFIRPVHPDGVTLRFNWNAAIAQDPRDASTIYFGSQFVHKSTNKGTSWEIISPDLTTNDTSKQKQLESGGLTYDATQAENNTTILVIAPSPLDAGTIWVGTDDGNLQLTRDGGETWTLLSDRLPDFPEAGWIPQIHPSTYAAGEAYVVVNNYRQNDWAPYLYRTRNHGESWERMVGEDDVWGHCLSVVQDPVAKNLLFLGTENGLYVSIDEGANWTKWTKGYPTVSTMDLKIHPREHDLVIGTFGRAAYVIDDITPLREMALEGASFFDKTIHAFTPPTAVQAAYQQAAGTRFAADAIYQGTNRRRGAAISFYVKEGQKEKRRSGPRGFGRGGRPGGPPAGMKKGGKGKMMSDTVKVEIMDASGEVLRTLKQVADSGVNRVYWGMNKDAVRLPMQQDNPFARQRGGAPVLPGTYDVRMSYRGDTSSTKIRVIYDPRIEMPEDVLKANAAKYDLLATQVEKVTKAMDRIREARGIAGTISKQLGEADSLLKDQTKAIQDSLKTLGGLIIDETEYKGIRDNPDVLVSKMFRINGYLRSSTTVDNPTLDIVMRQFEEEMNPIIQRVNAFFANEWVAYRKAFEEAKLSPFKDYEPIE